MWVRGRGRGRISPLVFRFGTISSRVCQIIQTLTARLRRSRLSTIRGTLGLRMVIISHQDNNNNNNNNNNNRSRSVPRLFLLGISLISRLDRRQRTSTTKIRTEVQMFRPTSSRDPLNNLTKVQCLRRSLTRVPYRLSTSIAET